MNRVGRRRSSVVDRATGGWVRGLDLGRRLGTNRVGLDGGWLGAL